MNSNRPIEHFVTLFDSKFLPMGMALHDSLMIHAQPFHLWILCMDELVEKQLKQISCKTAEVASQEKNQENETDKKGKRRER